jgi:hypothetical protein
MSTLAPAPPKTSPVPFTSPGPYRINVHEYDRIVAARALDDDLPCSSESAFQQGDRSCPKAN